MIGLIWAQADRGVIGADGTMPWHLPEDLAHFRAVTTGSAVLMGRRTWLSIPQRFRPLPGRVNLVLTRETTWADDGATPVHTVDEAVDLGTRDASGAPRDLWVIGGGQVYAALLDRASVAEVTVIDLAVTGDTTAPVLGEGWRRTGVIPPVGRLTSSTGLGYTFERWERA